MKVYQVNLNWDRGGPGNIAGCIHRELLRAGYRSAMAYGRPPCNEPGAYRIGSDTDEYLHAAGAKLFDREGLYSARATDALIADIKKENPDILQLHNLLGHYLHYPRLFRFIRESGIPTVWTLHDCWAFTGHCINFERVGCEKWKTECRDCPLRRDYPGGVLCDRSAKNFALKKQLFTGIPNLHLVAPSAWLAGLAKQSFLQEYDVRVINNGIDLSRYRPTPSDLLSQYGLEGKTVLLAVANVWNEMKGYFLLQEIAERLDDRYRVVMIGSKDESSLSEKILSLPKTSSAEELAKWYTAADLFINPTLGDNFPTVNIESLACGTPVVTNNTGGSPEIAGNECGRVVYSKTADEFLQKIGECLAAKIPEQACEERVKAFSPAYCYGKYLDLYREIAGNCG